jgi:hypothetical protein
MPKAYLTFEEKEKAQFCREKEKQISAIAGQFALTKHSIPVREIEKKVDYSQQVIRKVRNKPGSATLEQLYDICHALGKRLVITVE